MKRASILSALFVVSLCDHCIGQEAFEPLHLPFQINITVRVLYLDTIITTSKAPPGGSDIGTEFRTRSFGFRRWMDTPYYYFNRDTVFFTSIDSGNFSKIAIVFDSANHKASMEIEGEGIEDVAPYPQWKVWLKDFSYDSSNIFSTDSSLQDHLDSIQPNYRTSDEFNTFIETDIYTALKVLSIDLSGVFSPIHLFNPSDGVAVNIIPKNRLSFSNNACSFEPEPFNHTLNLYSTLGTRIASYSIAPGQTSLALPQLASGVYFVRLGGEVRKICVME